MPLEQKEYALRVEELKPRLYRTAVLYLGDVSSAEEALDEAVYRGLRGCRKLRQEEYFATWLTRILLSACADERKRKKRLLSIDTLPETAAEAFDALPLREAVRRLPEELKNVVILRYFSGYSVKQTAEILNIPQGTAATRQRKALALLRLELGEEETE